MLGKYNVSQKKKHGLKRSTCFFSSFSSRPPMCVCVCVRALMRASRYPPSELERPPEGAHAGAFFLTEAWVETIAAIKRESPVGTWQQAAVTMGTIGWMPEVPTAVEIERRGLADLIGSKWSWVLARDKHLVNANPVLEVRTTITRLAGPLFSPLQAIFPPWKTSATWTDFRSSFFRRLFFTGAPLC